MKVAINFKATADTLPGVLTSAICVNINNVTVPIVNDKY